jgi:hypothetical protein
MMVHTLDFIIVILSVVLTAVLSVYKLVQIYRYRKNPAILDRLINTTQVFPKRIARWLVDENYNEKHGSGGGHLVK